MRDTIGHIDEKLFKRESDEELAEHYYIIGTIQRSMRTLPLEYPIVLESRQLESIQASRVGPLATDSMDGAAPATSEYQLRDLKAEPFFILRPSAVRGIFFIAY